MSPPRQPDVTACPISGRDLRKVLDVLHALGDACAGTDDMAWRGIDCLPGLIGSDLTTLVVCDIESGHRVVKPTGLLSRSAMEVFDRYFHQHPLVRAHARNPHAVTARIADLLPPAEFRRQPLYNDYYRPLRIEHAMAMPIHVDRRFLVSFVFNRERTKFSDRERGLAEVLRPHVANLYRYSAVLDRMAAASRAASGRGLGVPLTPREREVLDWVAAGKTNRDVAAILGASPRTVEKHLERIYEKLGVETRTAAVMRAACRGADRAGRS